MRTVSPRTGYIYQAEPESCHLTCTDHVRARRLPRGLLCAHARMKPVGSSSLNDMHAQLPDTAILHPYGSKNLQKIVRVLVRDSVKPSSAHTGYINRANRSMCHLPRTGHVRAPEDCLGALYGQNIVGSFACSDFSHGYTVPLRIQKSSKNLADPHGIPCDYPRVPTVLAL